LLPAKTAIEENSEIFLNGRLFFLWFVILPAGFLAALVITDLQPDSFTPL